MSNSKKINVVNLIEEIVEDRLNNISENFQEDMEEKTSRKVKRFFDRLESASIGKYLDFKTPQQQAQAIVRFAMLVGVPKSQLSKVISNLKSTSKMDN